MNYILIDYECYYGDVVHFRYYRPSLTIYLNNLLNPLEQERLAKTLSRLRQGNKQNIDLLSPPEERLKVHSLY